MFLVLISWVIFAFEDLGQVGSYLGAMFGLNGVKLLNAETMYYLSNYIIIIVIGIIGSIPISNWIKKKIRNAKQNNLWKEWKQNTASIIVSLGCVAILIISTASLVNNSFNPFLYFRF